MGQGCRSHRRAPRNFTPSLFITFPPWPVLREPRCCHPLMLCCRDPALCAASAPELLMEAGKLVSVLREFSNRPWLDSGQGTGAIRNATFEPLWGSPSPCLDKRTRLSRGTGKYVRKLCPANREDPAGRASSPPGFLLFPVCLSGTGNPLLRNSQWMPPKCWDVAGDLGEYPAFLLPGDPQASFREVK